MLKSALIANVIGAIVAVASLPVVVIETGPLRRVGAPEAIRKAIAKFENCSAISPEARLRLEQIKVSGVILNADRQIPAHKVDPRSTSGWTVYCGWASLTKPIITLNTSLDAIKMCPLQPTMDHEVLHLLGYSHESAADDSEFQQLLLVCTGDFLR